MRHHFLAALLAGAVLYAPLTSLGWGVGHNDATRLGALISPEPFKSNSDLCVYGSYPDGLPDRAVGLHEEVYLRRLFSFEAIAALRDGDVPKAMFLASAATHFLTDYSCIAHAGQAWFRSDPWTQYLPRKYQGVNVPKERKQVYYAHLKATAPDTCLALPEPEYNLEKWRACEGSINAYFDSMPSVRGYVTPEMLRRPVDWTCTDADEYARWYGAFIALDMLDPASLAGPSLRLRDAVGMKAVCVEELLNGSTQCAAYFGYLCTAAKTEVSPSLDELLPPFDKLMAFAEAAPVVAISAQAPWPVERAAHLAALELLRAERRLAKTQKRPEPARAVGDYVLRVSAKEVLGALRDHNAIVLLTPEDQALAQAVHAPEIAPGSCGAISAEELGEPRNIAIILRGATRQDTLYVVDYLLDLSWAPINDPWPADRVVEAVKSVWPGWRLLLDLRKLKGEEAVAYARKFPGTIKPTPKDELAKCRAGLLKRTEKGESQEEWWRHFLLDLPLPDGRRVPEMIEKGTDYSALMEVVKQ